MQEYDSPVEVVTLKTNCVVPFAIALTLHDATSVIGKISTALEVESSPLSVSYTHLTLPTTILV